MYYSYLPKMKDLIVMIYQQENYSALNHLEKALYKCKMLLLLSLL